MFDNEVWASDPENIRNDLLRSTNFISLHWMIKEKFNLNVLFYHQPALNTINDFIFAFCLTVDFTLAKRFYFEFRVWYKYNDRPVNERKTSDLSIENGIRFEFL